MIVSLFFFTLCDTFSIWKGKEEQEHPLLVYAFGINERYFHLLKVFAILVFFQVPPCNAYTHIVHKENRGMLQLCLILIILLCFFVLSKIFSWEMKLFLLLLNALQLSTFYVNSSHMNSHKMENRNKKCQRTESQKRCNLENYVHVWVCLLT